MPTANSVRDVRPPDKIWYFIQGRDSYGPVSFVELQALVRRGDIVAADLVWRAGFKDWVEAETIPSLFPLLMQLCNLN